jgi:hypothetical protein
MAASIRMLPVASAVNRITLSSAAGGEFNSAVLPYNRQLGCLSAIVTKRTNWTGLTTSVDWGIPEVTRLSGKPTRITRLRALARRANHFRVLTHFHESPAPFAKIFLFFRRPNHFRTPAVSRPLRGAYRDRHDTLGAGCDGCGGVRLDGFRAGRERCRIRRSRVVLTPRRWCQVSGSNSAGDGGKKARSPGRARYKL